MRSSRLTRPPTQETEHGRRAHSLFASDSRFTSPRTRLRTRAACSEEAAEPGGGSGARCRSAGGTYLPPPVLELPPPITRP
jgi:hypothetical protein